MNVKTGFRRIVALFLSFAMVFSTFAGLLPGGIVFAADTDPEMHIIIQHWHAGEPEPVLVDAKLDKDARTLTFNVTTKPTETFAGFAVSAGNDCVTLDPDEKTSEGAAKTPSITVKYDANVHLVKVHVFYSAKPKLVPGTKMEAGTDEGNIGKYEDTKTQTWESLGVELQQKIKDAIGSDGVIDPDLLDGGDLIKLYNTSEGLHTDKTATPVYNSDTNNAGTTDKDVEETGTRVFDINLEAWYNDQATAKVGLILDASGSMAFISEGLEPMQFRREGGGYELPDGTVVNVNANEYLTPEQVNRILDTNLTDNSKLSYSDYSYYIYDTRDFTQEFVPLAYWGGKEYEPEPVTLTKVEQIKNIDEKTILGYYSFDNDHRNSISSTNEKLTVKKDASGKYVESLDGFTRDGRSYDDSAHSPKAFGFAGTFSKGNGENRIAFAAPTDNTFTISFDLYTNDENMIKMQLENLVTVIFFILARKTLQK